MYAIHNLNAYFHLWPRVVLSGFQRYFCMQYTTSQGLPKHLTRLFYQDFKDTFVCNTQQGTVTTITISSCFIRISKILLYAIHNHGCNCLTDASVVLSGFQRYFCMQYTTQVGVIRRVCQLFYQDFKDTFVCNTQLLTTWTGWFPSYLIRMSMNNSAAKVQKIHEICKSMRKYFVN